MLKIGIAYIALILIKKTIKNISPINIYIINIGTFCRYRLRPEYFYGHISILLFSKY